MMRRWIVVARWVKMMCWAVAAWMVLQSIAFAQGMGLPKQTEKPAGSYVFSYIVVLLGVGLGMALVCRSSRRRDRARPEQYEEVKLAFTDEEG